MSSDLDALFAAAPSLGDNQLKNISGLIEEERAAHAEIGKLEEMLTDAKERRTKLRNATIPQAMIEAGVRQFTTDAGTVAKIAFSTDGALGSAKTAEEFAIREAKIDLIIENGGGEIVKQVVAISFPKEMARNAEGLKNWLDHYLTGAELSKAGQHFDEWLSRPKEERGHWPVAIGRERSIHHQTLGSWIKSVMEDDDVSKRLTPETLEKLGIWYGEIAKITEPKPQK